MPVGRANRRAFIAALGGAAVSWQQVAKAQQSHIQRIALLTLRSQETPATLLARADEVIE